MRIRTLSAVGALAVTCLALACRARPAPAVNPDLGNADTPRRTLLVLNAPRLVPAHDSVHLTVVRQRCIRDLCSGVPLLPTEFHTWAVDPPDLAAVDSGGRLMARTAGQIRITVTVGGTVITRDITVLPPVASLRWEPEGVSAYVGDTITLRAVARDDLGNLVAVIPAASMVTADGPTPLLIERAEAGVTILVPSAPGHVVLNAQLGSHSARVDIDVVVRNRRRR